MEYNYTYETLETMLLKRSLTDKRYLGIMSEHFDDRWFQENPVDTAIMKMSILFLKKNNRMPSFAVLGMMGKKYCETHPSVKISDFDARILELKSFEVPNDDMTDENLGKYIKEKAYYFAIYDNTDSIRNKGDISKCMERFDRINKIMIRDDNLGLDYFSKEGQDSHWDYIMNPEAKLSTGWRALDFHTNGGFLRDGRMLALFVGQAGLGKSLFLSNIAVNFLKQNKTVVVISLEMSENVYASRFSAIISNDNINGLRGTAESSRKKVSEFYAKYPKANLIVKEYPPSSIRVVDVERYLEKLVENGTSIDAIVIDYLNLLLPNTKEDNMYMAIKKVSEQLRAISYKFRAPVISATQSNREGFNNEHIDLQNISESSGPAATSDFIGSLFRSDEDRSHGIINMRISKNRFGAPGSVIQFQHNNSNMVLTDVTFNSESQTQNEADTIVANMSNLREEDFTDI